VDLVDTSVERAPMHGAMGPVMPCILQYEEDGDLQGHRRKGWEGNISCHAAVFCHWVEEPDLG